jgi:hypothetical protein
MKMTFGSRALGPALALLSACGSTGTSQETDMAVVQDAALVDMTIQDAEAPAPTPDVGPDVFVPEPDAALPDAALPDAALPDVPPSAYTREEVQALLDERCVGCHIGGMQGGLTLTSFTMSTVRVPANEAPLNRIEPGDHQRSYLWHKLNGTHDTPEVGGSGTRMPQGGVPFTGLELTRLALFIDELPAPPPEICDNGQDDDDDLQVDCGDPGCADDAHCQVEDCGDDVDNDADGDADCADADCAEDPQCAPEDCANGEDDNLDTLVDCQDPLCDAFPACVTEICDNGADDNADGLTDCNDDDCFGVPGCMVAYTEEEMQQLFNANCVGCHVGGQALGGLSLDAPFAARTVNVAAVRPPLDRIEPGDRQRSFLFRKLEGTQAEVGGGNRMPSPGDRPLNRLQIERVGLYIDTLPALQEQCANRIDDDQDRLIDCADADCAADAACQIRENCGNGADDDGDFWVDCQDMDCQGQPACGAAEDCANNRDDDGDQLIDCRDANCVGAAACAVVEVCADGNDNDADGAVDCGDADCALDAACPAGEDCTNGADDDGDTLADCLDGECLGVIQCQAEICGNQRDDNADGFTDCADPDCRGAQACQPEDCNNGVDDNGDGQTDCEAAVCQADVHCQPEDCVNGMDDNANGRVDCDDVQCENTLFCTREVCDDALDNDNDGFTDCFDSDCSISPRCIVPMTEQEVQSMFDMSCGCHGGGAPAAGMTLGTPFAATTVNVPANSGGGLDRIEPGDHLASFLWLKMAGQQAANQGVRMPRGGPYLSDVDLARFALYIDQLR